MNVCTQINVALTPNVKIHMDLIIVRVTRDSMEMVKYVNGLICVKLVHINVISTLTRVSEVKAIYAISTNVKKLKNTFG